MCQDIYQYNKNLFRKGKKVFNLFFNRKEFSRLLFIFCKTFFLRLSALCKRHTYKQKQHVICYCTCKQKPVLWHKAHRTQANTPPHENFTKIVWVSAVMPQTVTNKATLSAFAKSVHLHVCNTLQCKRNARNKQT